MLQGNSFLLGVSSSSSAYEAKEKLEGKKKKYPKKREEQNMNRIERERETGRQGKKRVSRGSLICLCPAVCVTSGFFFFCKHPPILIALAWSGGACKLVSPNPKQRVITVPLLLATSAAERMRSC
jgi:hypothetical protein